LTDPSIKKAVCGNDPLSCFECCRADGESCASTASAGSTTPSATVVASVKTCQSTYKTCVAGCRQELKSHNSTLGKVDVDLKLKLKSTVEAAAAYLLLNIATLRQKIFDGSFANNTYGLTVSDLTVLGVSVDTTSTTRRATTTPTFVTIDYSVRASSDLQADIVGDTATATESNSLALAIGTVIPLDTSVASNSTVEAITDLTVTTTSGTTSGGSDGGSTTTTAAPTPVVYQVATPVATLPPTATLTEQQKLDLIANLIEALGLPFDAQITVSVSGGAVTAVRQYNYQPTNDELAADAGVLVPIQYTKADGTTATTTGQTQASTASAVVSTSTSSESSGNSNLAVGLGVGLGVGLLLVIVVVAVIMSRKSRRPVHPGMGQSSFKSERSNPLFQESSVASTI